MAKISSLTEVGLRSTHKELFTYLGSGLDMENGSSRMWYAWGLTKRGGYAHSRRDVCSRGLYHISDYDKKKGVRIFPTIRPSMLKMYKEESVRFFNWVARDSIFANALKTRSFAHAFTYGYTLNAKEDVYLTHFGCQLIRQLQEHPAKVLVWDSLVQDHQVDPLAAFVLAERIRGSTDNVQWNSYYRHGDLFSPKATSMAKVLAGNPTLGGEPYLKARSYRNVGYMFSGGEKEDRLLDEALTEVNHFECLKDFAKKVKAESEPKKVGYVNPFAAAQESCKVSPKVAALYLMENFKEFLCP